MKSAKKENAFEETVAFTKERVEGFLNKSKNEQAALKAQQAAIKEEASANNEVIHHKRHEIQELKKKHKEDG